MSTDDLITRLEAAYRRAADPKRAAPMAAYMRHQFSFLGIPKPRRVAVDREVLAGARPTPADALEVAWWCWLQPEREFQYFACERLDKAARRLAATDLDVVHGFITTKSWWDTVDALASRVVGPMVLAHPDLTAAMDRWIRDDNLWVARTAILHQLGYKAEVDQQRLFGYCRMRADHPDFFIRKAIGWALRQYAQREPDEVRIFLRDHGHELSALSVKEASKHL